MVHSHPTIILNPASGQGDSRQRVNAIRQAAQALGWQGKLIQTTPDKLATYIANREYQLGQRSFIICGGDGTIIEAVEALAGRGVTIGIVPLGTGNLLAKNLNLPLTIPEAMAVALQGSPGKIDIGQANDTYFAIMAGMGVDAQIMRDTTRSLKNTLGIVAYYWTGLRKIGQPPLRFQLIIDGRELRYQAKSILVANLGKFAGQQDAVPHTQPDDGRLKVGVIRARTVRDFASIAFNALKGQIHHSPHYSLLEGRSILIKPLHGPQPYQCDGNDYPPTSELAITVHPQAIAIRQESTL